MASAAFQPYKAKQRDAPTALHRWRRYHRV